jgi:hypothetical protein
MWARKYRVTTAIPSDMHYFQFPIITVQADICGRFYMIDDPILSSVRGFEPERGARAIDIGWVVPGDHAAR